MIRHEDFPLSTILYYRIGGRARYLLEAAHREDVLEALDFVRTSGIDRLMVVGHGSNLLFPDEDFDGAVLRITTGDHRHLLEVEQGLVEAFAGESMDDLISYSFDRGYAGLEWAGGLPGTVGAALRGNVGAFGGELKDTLERAELLEMGESAPTVRTLGNADLGFAYRSSVVKENRRLLVLSAAFRLRPVEGGELDAARQSYRSNIEYREKNHPMEYPTCGSVFKNIEKRDEVEMVLAVWPEVRESVEGRWHGKVSMGYVVNRLGLRGHQMGRAQISPKHSNFIVNLGGAGFADVCGLIDLVKQRCDDTLGFVPEAEVEIVDPGRR